jgi:hypothetical protein
MDESITRRIIVVLIGLIETLLGFRFIFKLAGANPANTIIKMLYDVTDLVVGVFANIFSPITNNGVETASVFEPGTLIAMVVIGLITLAIFKLMPQNTSVDRNTTEHVNVNQNTNDQGDRN